MKSSDWLRWSSNGLYASFHHPCFELMRNFLKNFFGFIRFSNLKSTNQIKARALWPMRNVYLFENSPKRELLIPKSFEPEERPMNFRKGTNWTISRDALWPFIGLFSSFPSPSKSSIASKSALPTPRIWWDPHVDKILTDPPESGGSDDPGLGFGLRLTNNDNRHGKIWSLHNFVFCFLKICYCSIC